MTGLGDRVRLGSFIPGVVWCFRPGPVGSFRPGWFGVSYPVGSFHPGMVFHTGGLAPPHRQGGGVQPVHHAGLNEAQARRVGASVRLDAGVGRDDADRHDGAQPLPRRLLVHAGLGGDGRDAREAVERDRVHVPQQDVHDGLHFHAGTGVHDGVAHARLDGDFLGLGSGGHHSTLNPRSFQSFAHA